MFGDDQLAATVIDRVARHDRPLRFEGESCRVRHALMQDGAQRPRSVLDARAAQKQMRFLLNGC